MSSRDPVFVIRQIRRRQPASPVARYVIVGALIMLVVVIGLLIMMTAQTLAVVTRGLPDVEVVDDMWGPLGREAFVPAQLMDRSGEHVLYEFLADTPEEPAWVRVRSGGENAAPQYVVDAVIAAVDPDFWDAGAYSPGSLLSITRSILAGADGAFEGNDSIAASLARAILIPPPVDEQDRWAEPARIQLLAAELSNLYSRTTLLEWYLNSVDFGHAIYGLDTAALYYFGLHAAELDLGQGAALAAILAGEGDPWNHIDGMIAAQTAVLDHMVETGAISRTAARQAAWEDAGDEFRSGFQHELKPALVSYVESILTQTFGPALLGRPGLQILSTIDYDLQVQVECAVETQLQRLNGGEGSGTATAVDGSACIAAGLLPSLRPGDAGEDHAARSASVVVIDNATGHILAVDGDVESGYPAGASLYPFLYLTAFSRGYAPGSMILDIAVDGATGMLEGQGPVLMRTALVDGLSAAASRLLELIGEDALEQTYVSFGLQADAVGGSFQARIDPDQFLLSPLNAAFSYSAIANQGVLAGSPLSSNGAIQPAAIAAILSAGDEVLYVNTPQRRAVVSTELAYLLVDILSDAPTTLARAGQGSALDLGAASISMIAETQAGGEWTIGSTPSVTVAVYMASEGTGSRDLTALNGPAPIWHAVLRYAVREESPFEEWPLPAGVTEMEVCSPSGMLPTIYCPEVVNEVFLQGTEPTQLDQLYQPVLINRETGNLATLYTPPELVEERIYLVPPAGVEAWAEAAGIPQPPQEYDSLQVDVAVNPDVRIQSPQPFDIVRGTLMIRGRVRPEDLAYFRIQIGEGLNPTRWIQAGEDLEESVYSGVLGEVDTQDLSGLYTIQLLAVLDDGLFITDAVTITVDNQSPDVSILAPDTENRWVMSSGDTLRIQINAEDEVGVSRVALYVDNRRMEELESAPYTFVWQSSEVGEHILMARAYDLAGNFTDSEPLVVEVVP